MKMQLEHGRPLEEKGREMREIRCYDLLDRLGIDFWRVDHDAARIMEDCAAADALLGEDTAICKNLFLRNSKGDQYFLLMLPGDKKFKTKEVARQIGSTRLSFGDEGQMAEFLDILPGSVSVMGLMNDAENRVQLLIDRPVIESETFGCHPCVNTSSLRMKTKDVLEKFLPAVHHEAIVVDLPDYE